MWELDYKESWALKNWCFWTVVLEKTLSWTARRSNQSILKEISPGCSFRRTDVETETRILWPPDAKSRLVRKDPDAGRDWSGRRRGWDGWMASLTRWMGVWVNSGVGDGQGGLACCDSRSHKEWDTTEQLNWLSPYMQDCVWADQLHPPLLSEHYTLS